MGDGGRPLGRRRCRLLLLGGLALCRMLSRVLARTLPAFFDLRLELGTDVPLAAAASARPVLRLGSAPRLLLAAVAAGFLRPTAAAARLLLLSAAVPWLLLRSPLR